MNQTDPVIAETILNSVADGVFTVDTEWLITSFNAAAEKITGVRREDALGRPCCDVLRASICESACALRETQDTGRPIVNKAVYVLRPDGQRVPISISTSLLKDSAGCIVGGVETFRDLSLVEELRRRLEQRQSLADIIGRSAVMQNLFALLPAVAASESTVVIQGASGTGKELVASAIHQLSPRRNEPFVAINCGALPDTLLESELFGHTAGAFTDARRDKPGRFALAEGGTLFLDEIGELPMAAQARLLRILQGGDHGAADAPDTDPDVRILAATHRDLRRLVQESAFRSDLYFRLRVVEMVLPPLRERGDDVIELSVFLLDKARKQLGRPPLKLSREALDAIRRYHWPGNVRELSNAIERAVILCEGDVITPELLAIDHRVSSGGTAAELNDKLSLEEYFRVFVLEHQDQMTETELAQALGISRKTLWERRQRFGLPRPKRRG